MKIHYNIFYLLILLLFSSCNKEGPLNDNSIRQNTYLSQILDNGKPVNEYIYNSLDLISEKKSKYDLSVDHYNDLNQLSSTEYYVNYNIISADAQVADSALNQTQWVTPDNSNKSGTLDYTYNSSGQLIKTTYKPVGGIPQSSEYTYNNDNRIEQEILRWGDTETGYINYVYDNQGNLIEEYLYNINSGVAELIVSKKYEYDNEINPFKSVSRTDLPGIYSNQNNIVKEIYTMYAKAGKGSDNVQITENYYQYDNFGYPISKNDNIKYVYK